MYCINKKNFHIYKKKKDIAKRTYFDSPYLQIFNRKTANPKEITKKELDNILLCSIKI